MGKLIFIALLQFAGILETGTGTAQPIAPLTSGVVNSSGQITQPAPAPPAPAIELPFSSIQIDVGDLLAITPKSAVAEVRWFVSPRTGAAALACGNAIHFAAKLPGEYTATCFTIVGGKISDPFEVRITVGQAPQPPPGPGPGPTPTPIPIPPPVDPFPAAVAAAYAADGKPAAQAAQLASIYKFSGPVVNNPTFKTAKDVLDTMHSVAQSLLGDGFKNTRRTIADELNRAIGQTNADLTPAIRTTMQAQFARMQAILEGLR
jgi:hypothetical protein